jgi:hypothetical protein
MYANEMNGAGVGVEGRGGWEMTTEYYNIEGRIRPNQLLLQVGDYIRDFLRKNINKFLRSRNEVEIGGPIGGGQVVGGPGGLEWGAPVGEGKVRIFIGSDMSIDNSFRMSYGRGMCVGIAINIGNFGMNQPPVGWRNGQFWNWGLDQDWGWQERWMDDFENSLPPDEQEELLDTLMKDLISAATDAAGHYLLYDCGMMDAVKNWFGSTVTWRPCNHEFNPQDPHGPNCPSGIIIPWYDYLRDATYLEDLHAGPFYPLGNGPPAPPSAGGPRPSDQDWSEVDDMLDSIREMGDNAQDNNWWTGGGGDNSNLIINNQGNAGAQVAVGSTSPGTFNHPWDESYVDTKGIWKRAKERYRTFAANVRPNPPLLLEFDNWMAGFKAIMAVDNRFRYSNDRNPLNEHYKTRQSFFVPLAFPAGHYPGGDTFFHELGYEPFPPETNRWTGNHNAKNYRP